MELYQYVGRISDSVVNLLAHFQTGEEMARRSHGIEGGALVELRIAWHAPLRAGGLFTIHSGIAATGRKTQHFVHLFFDEVSRACVATAEGIAVAMDEDPQGDRDPRSEAAADRRAPAAAAGLTGERKTMRPSLVEELRQTVGDAASSRAGGGRNAAHRWGVPTRCEQRR